MSDDFEDQLKQWLRHRAGDDQAAVRALAGNVATLPRRRASPNWLVPLAAGIAVLVGVAWLLGPRLATVTNTTTATPTNLASFRPGDPAAFANDPRLAQCPLVRDDIETVFEMSHAATTGASCRTWASRRSSTSTRRPSSSSTARARRSRRRPAGAASTQVPGTRIVCVVPTGEPPNVYVDVDITGLTLDVVPSSPGPATPSGPEPPPASGPTPTPAPAWYAGPEVLLECQSGRGEFGQGWQPGDLDTSPMSSGQHALAHLLDAVYRTASSFPETGFRPADSTADGEVYTETEGGAIRAVVVTRSAEADGSGPWRVTGVAACDPGELGADLPSGAVAGICAHPIGEPRHHTEERRPWFRVEAAVRLQRRLTSGRSSWLRRSLQPASSTPPRIADPVAARAGTPATELRPALVPCPRRLGGLPRALRSRRAVAPRQRRRLPADRLQLGDVRVESAKSAMVWRCQLARR